MARESISKYLYLRTIRELGRDGAKVRNIDIANVLGYSRPSITNAVRRLSNEGLVTVEKKGGILLTETGRAEAEKANARSVILSDFFKRLGAEEKTALENASRIEPLITDELLDLMRMH